MTQVSVIIPTYNRRHTLPRALDSVLAQSHPASEIIVIDDGSTDGTAGLIQQHYPQTHYLYQDNRGVSAARNLGIQHARHEWIALLDSDDQWLPKKLEQQCRALSDNPEYLICHCDEIWIRHGKRVNPMKKHRKFGGWIFHHCLPLCAISPSAAVIHRSLFEELGGFDESLPACEDYDLWLRICARHPVLFIDRPLLIKYGGHADQLSRRYWGMDRFRIRALDNILRQGRLKPEDEQAARAMLLEKIRIYSQGARKRGRHEEAERYQHLARQHVGNTNTTENTPS